MMDKQMLYYLIAFTLGYLVAKMTRGINGFIIDDLDCSDVGKAPNWGCPSETECKEAGSCMASGQCEINNKANGTYCDLSTRGSLPSSSDHRCLNGKCILPPPLPKLYGNPENYCQASETIVSIDSKKGYNLCSPGCSGGCPPGPKGFTAKPECVLAPSSAGSAGSKATGCALTCSNDIQCPSGAFCYLGALRTKGVCVYQ